LILPFNWFNKMFAKKGTHSPNWIASGLASAALALALLPVAGCGDTYRPVVAGISPVGPTAQPTKYAVATSDPCYGASLTTCSTPGLVTFVDFSGDTIMITAELGVGPQYLALNPGGTEGFSLNRDGSLNSFQIATSLITNQVLSSTLLTGANPNSILPGSINTYVTQPGRGSLAVMTGTPISLKQEIPVAAGPVYVVGIPSAKRFYEISQAATSNQITSIDPNTNLVLNTISLPAASAPIYGIMSTDGNRVYILDQGTNSVSVINVQSDQLDSFILPGGSTPTSSIPVGKSPVWVDFYTNGNELFVVNAGDSTLSLINVPLCNTIAQPTNPNCSTTNPTDSTSFGQTLATVPLGAGENPFMVTVLQDGTQAFVANTGGGSVSPSVSVVSMTSNTVIKTINFDGLAGDGPACTPNFIASTTGEPTGKVYVTCANNQTLTIIRTDTDTLEATLPLQGAGIMVRMTSQ